jgi:tRNA (guanosine-2'-O-)-methyltransferase
MKFAIFDKNYEMINLDYLAFLENMLTDARKQKFLDVLANRTNHFTVAVEDVFQLHNTSAVMRSCEVFGIQNLHVVEQKFGKQIDAEIAMGAQKWVDINRYDDIESCLQQLKNKDYQIIATSPHENDFLLDDFDLNQKSALFFGTEKEGLSEKVLQQADGFLKIPMVGFTESLNISVSVAIILQNLTSRLRKLDINWHLSHDEVMEKRLVWAKNSIKDIKRIEERYFQEQNNLIL